MNNNLYERISNLSVKAVEYANSSGITLDYTDKSIKDLENILEFYYRDFEESTKENNPPTEEEIWANALMWGSYLGEVLRKNVNKDIAWVNSNVFGDGQVLHLKHSTYYEFFPIEKVYKRLKFGNQENVEAFYYVTKSYILGSIKD